MGEEGRGRIHVFKTQDSLPGWGLSSSRRKQASRGLWEDGLQERANLIHLSKKDKKGNINIVFDVVQ